MFNSTVRPRTATTVASNTSNSTFTFTPPTTSQPWNTFGTSSTSQPLIFGASGGVPNTSTIRPFGNPPTSTTPANFTPTNFAGTPIFGTNQTTPVAQPNVFGSNLTGTTVRFGPVSAQGSIPSSTKFSSAFAPFSTASTNSNIFGSNNTITTTASPFSPTTSTIFGTSSGLFNQTFPTAPATLTTTPAFPGFNPLTTTPATSNIFGIPTTSPATTTTTPAFPGFNPLTTTPATSNIFGIPTTSPATTTTASVFPGFNPMTTTPATSNIFGIPTMSPATAPVFPGFNPKATTPATSNIFGVPTTSPATTATASVFPGFHPMTTTPATSNIFGIPTTSPATLTTTPAFPGFNPITTTPATSNIFGVPTTSPATTTTTPAFPGFNPMTTTPVFPGFNPMTTTPVTSNIFGIPTTSSATTIPFVNNNVTQPTNPTTGPFSFPLSATSILNTSASAATTASTSNPPLFPGLAATQTQPTVTSSSSTILSQASKQEQDRQQSASIIQQQFLIASLLDPYANRGKKDFTNIDQIQVPTQSAVVSTLSPTTNTTTITTSTPIPIILPIQSNSRKVSSSRSSVDVNFKLKPVSSSPILNDDIKPSNQQSMVSTGPVKSTLAGNFTDEEEIVLLSRTKMSKLRLSNDMIESSNRSDPIRSLYPIRRLADLEKLTNITPRPSSSPTITVNNERTSRSSSETRDVSRSHHSTSSISPKRSSSPIIQRKSNDNNSQNYRLPILTRDNYYMKPTISELKTLFNDKGQCIIKQFTVGHEKYGSVTFYGQINVAGLNLDEIIEINRHEVTVYPDDNNKPSIGEELNIPARITLLGVYPIDRTTREEITDIERIKALNYNDYLSKVTKKFDGEFVNYGISDGSWTFMVKHFTRYGLDDE